MQNLQERVHHDGNGGIELLQSFPGRLHPHHLEHSSWLLCQPGECFDLNWWYPWLDIHFMTPTGGWLCDLAWKDIRGWVDHPLLQVRYFGTSDMPKLTKLMASKKPSFQHDCLRTRRRASFQVGVRFWVSSKVSLLKIKDSHMSSCILLPWFSWFLFPASSQSCSSWWARTSSPPPASPSTLLPWTRSSSASSRLTLLRTRYCIFWRVPSSMLNMRLNFFVVNTFVFFCESESQYHSYHKSLFRMSK